MRRQRVSLLALVLLPGVAVAAACGSSNSATPDAGVADSGLTSDSGGQDTGASEAAAVDSGTHDSAAEAAPGDGACPAPPSGTFVQAAHGPLPTMAFYGGPVLAAPQIVAFTFPTTANAAALQAFSATITQTPWFAEVSRDYCTPDGGSCIGPGPTGISVPLTTAPDTSYVDTFGVDAGALAGTNLQQFINEQVQAAVAAKTIPAPGPSSLYIFYFPSTTTITIDAPGQGGSSCSSFGGYHNNMTYVDGTTQIAYAILPDCAPGRTSELSSVTVAASHEIIEATTDPQPSGTLGWYLDQPMTPHPSPTVAQFRNDPWATALTYGEVGDNCESLPLRTWVLDAGQEVQRIWSTSAASQGHNPCVPVPASETYYNVSPDKALYVANVGETFTVDLSAFTDVSRPAWRVAALDETRTTIMTTSGTPLPYLKFEFVGGIVNSSGVSELTCVNNGTTGQLQVTLLADPASDTSLTTTEEWPEADAVLESVDPSNPQTRTGRDGGTIVTYPYQFWPFAVITPGTATMLGVTSAGVADARKVAALRAARHVQAPRMLEPER